MGKLLCKKFSLIFEKFVELIRIEFFFFCFVSFFIAGDPCTQISKYMGIGDHSLTRWSFDPVEKKCLSFQYHGLKGNENNFLSKEACEAKCPGIFFID